MPDTNGMLALTPPGRIAVVGAGPFGRFTIESYAASRDLSVLAVADQDESALRAVPISGLRLTTDWRTILADEQIEVVHIATPPFVRGILVDATLAAGKSVFCEKPLALSIAEADGMIEEAKHAGVGLGVDYVMRYHPAYCFLSALAAAGVLGRPRSISFQNFAQAVPPGHWFWDRTASGGILVEHGVHFFDAFGLIAGRAHRVAGRQLRTDAVEVTICYESGVIGRYYHEFGFPHDIEYASGVVVFEAGHVAIEGWIPTRLTGAAVGPQPLEGNPAGPEASARTLVEIAASCDIVLDVTAVGGVVRFQADFPDRSEQYQKAIVAGMRDLVRRHRDPQHRPAVTAHDGRASLAIALAAQRACDTSEVVLL